MSDDTQIQKPRILWNSAGTSFFFGLLTTWWRSPDNTCVLSCSPTFTTSEMKSPVFMPSRSAFLGCARSFSENLDSETPEFKRILTGPTLLFFCGISKKLPSLWNKWIRTWMTSDNTPLIQGLVASRSFAKPVPVWMLWCCLLLHATCLPWVSCTLGVDTQSRGIASRLRHHESIHTGTDFANECEPTQSWIRVASLEIIFDLIPLPRSEGQHLYFWILEYIKVTSQWCKVLGSDHRNAMWYSLWKPLVSKGNHVPRQNHYKNE